MRAALLACFLTLALMLPASAQVTTCEYQKVQVGWYRGRVQALFGTTGHKVFLYFDARGRRHLMKAYRAADDTVVMVTYLGPPTVDHWNQGPYRVVDKYRRARQ